MKEFIEEFMEVPLLLDLWSQQINKKETPARGFFNGNFGFTPCNPYGCDILGA